MRENTLFRHKSQGTNLAFSEARSKRARCPALVKNHQSKNGGMITPLFEWFLIMSEILEISEHYQKAMLSEAVRTSKFEEF